MTELGFLLELLLNHKLPKAARDLVLERVKGISATCLFVPTSSGIDPKQIAAVPSSRDVAVRHPDLVPQTVAVVAQTPQAIAAMASRQVAINESLAGKVDKTTGRPRKF